MRRGGTVEDFDPDGEKVHDGGGGVKRAVQGGAAASDRHSGHPGRQH